LKYVNPTNDLAFKKVLGNNENIHILEGFIRDFFLIDPKGLTVENPYSIKAYKELIKDEETYKLRLTASDVAAVMDFADYRSELQIRKAIYFDERSLYYPLNKFVSRYRVEPGKVSAYSRLRPIYSLNILGYNNFSEDEDALRIFQLYDPVRNKHFPKKILNLGYFELLKPNVETENQRQWQNYFLQKPLSDDAPDYIRDALQIIDESNMDEEELDMMKQVEYYQSVYDDTVSHAREEGINEGKDEAKFEIARNMLSKDYTIEDISEITGLSKDEILEIQNSGILV